MNSKRALTILSVVVFLIILLLAITGYLFLKNLNLNDGPFYGERREECDLINPNSTLELSEGIRLESFPRGENERSATIRLIKHNTIAWCIYAHAYSHSYVDKIDFHSLSNESYNNIKIEGSVHWTHGYEASIWHIDNNGELIEYWYSW